ncbi:MAG: hypothetical protein WDM78_20140 [Puia sp.]
MSTDNGVTWVPVSGASAISYTITNSIYTQTLYRRTVNDVCGNSAVSVPITISMNSSAPGDPTVFGNNTWNVYCFQDINYSIYAGYYTEPLLTFSTPNRLSCHFSSFNSIRIPGLPADQYILFRQYEENRVHRRVLIRSTSHLMTILI